jgi:trehalose-phosphatase
VGNHGLEIEGQGISFVHEYARQVRHAIEFACADLESALAGVCGLLVEDKGLTATVHYRMAPAHLLGWIDATIHVVMRPFASWLSVNPARKAWEIRPRIDWNKGSALGLVLDRMGGVNPLLICAGDDTTDEDMFRVLPDAISVQVGDRLPTAACYRVDGPAGLVKFLEVIAVAIQAGSETPLVC